MVFLLLILLHLVGVLLLKNGQLLVNNSDILNGELYNGDSLVVKSLVLLLYYEVSHELQGIIGQNELHESNTLSLCLVTFSLVLQKLDLLDELFVLYVFGRETGFLESSYKCLNVTFIEVLLGKTLNENTGGTDELVGILEFQKLFIVMCGSLLFIFLLKTLLRNLQGAQQSQFQVTLAITVSHHKSFETADLLDIRGLAV